MTELHSPGGDLLGQSESEIFIGIHGGIADAHFIVQMGAGAATAQSNIADGIAPANRLSGGHGKSGEMPVAGADAVAVLDLNQAAVTAHDFGFGDAITEGVVAVPAQRWGGGPGMKVRRG